MKPGRGDFVGPEIPEDAERDVKRMWETKLTAAGEVAMREDERLWAVKRLLFDFVRSPSLRHIRDPNSVVKLAQEIVRELDQRHTVWRKWDDQRELLLKSALACWIPIADLQDHLNQMPGPSLTGTDVEQRLRAFEDEEYYSYPKEELKSGCLAIYGQEKLAGTELPAIIGVLANTSSVRKIG